MSDKKHIVNITALIKDPNKEKFLIVKRSQNEVAYPGKWGFPGGKLEKGETILQALKREILEEVGIGIEDHKKFLLDYTFERSDGNSVVGLCFEVIARDDNVKLDKNDFDDYRWIASSELNDFDHVERMEEVISVAFKS